MDCAAAWGSELQSPPQHHQPHHPSYIPYAAAPAQTHLNLFHHSLPPSSSSSSYYPNHNPNPNPSPSPLPHYGNPNPSPLPHYGNPNPAAFPAPAVGHYLSDPYAPHGGYSVGPAAGAGAGAIGGLAGYYYERIGGKPYGSAANEAVSRYDTIGYAQVAPGPSNGFDPAATLHVAPHRWGAQSNYKGGRKKGSKPTKVVQSAYCAVCKIDCSSQEDLNTHKQGKKHKKNLQKLQELITPKPQGGQVTTCLVEKKEAPAPAPALDEGKAVRDEGETAPRKTAKRKEAPEEDVETKKMKMIAGGAEPKELRVCILCNVVVNSENVYASHVAGSKHAAMVKKQEEASAS